MLRYGVGCQISKFEHAVHGWLGLRAPGEAIQLRRVVAFSTEGTVRKYLCLLALSWMAIESTVSIAWADGDPDRGQKLFARCSACHAATEQNKVGPGLLGGVGRGGGTVAGYSYSAAMKSSGIIWDEGTLDAFLRSPSGVVKGTRMAISVPKDQDRGDLIAYLKTLTAH